MEVIADAFVLCRAGRVEAVGPMTELPAGLGDVEELDGRGLAAIPGLRRLPHARVLRRRSRARVLAARRRRLVRGAACRRRRDPLDRASDARRGRGGARPRHGAPPLVDARARHDDLRGQVGLRSRPRHGARPAAGGARGRRDPDVARCPYRAARVRRRGRVPRLRARRGAPGGGAARRGGGRLPRARLVRRRAGAPLPRGLP